MVRVYLKNLRKNWKSGTIPPLIMALIIPLIASIWPQLESAAEIFKTIMENPVYQAFLGALGLVDVGTWEGMYYMYIFIWLEMILLFIVIFFPSRIITTEIDKKTLDMSLSLPIPRWRYLLEKFGVYLTYNLLYPILILPFSYFCTALLIRGGHDVSLNYTTLTYSVIGVWMWFFVLGAISLLCGVLFLDSRRALSASAAVILGMYIIVRIGGMVDNLSWLQYFSIFNYMAAGNIHSADPIVFPVVDFFILCGIGIVALVSALIIFQKRELTY